MSDTVVTIFNESQITFWGVLNDVPTEIYPNKVAVVELTEAIQEKIDERRFQLIRKETKDVLAQIPNPTPVVVTKIEKSENATTEKVRVGTGKKG